MNTYKNISYSAKTFYGVKFLPGEAKSVPGYINDQGMVRIFGIKPVSAKTSIGAVPTTPSIRGRKKKSSEAEEGSVADKQEIKLETQEENTDGNQC